MGFIRWRFTKINSPSEVITLQDPGSARVLAQFLQHYEMDQWQLEEEHVEKDSPTLVSLSRQLEKTAFFDPSLAAFDLDTSATSPEINSEATPSSEIKAELQPVIAESEGSLPPGSPPAIFATEKQNGKRRHIRFPVEFRVIMVTEGKVFRSYTTDVSVGGMLLKQKIPASMSDKVCTIFIGSLLNKENIELSCKIISDAKCSRRIMFQGGDIPSLKRLEDWILKANAAKAGGGVSQAA